MRMLLPSRPYERSRIAATPAATIATTATENEFSFRGLRLFTQYSLSRTLKVAFR